MAENLNDDINYMSVVVDGVNHDLDVSDTATFAELIRKIELELVPKGRVITHIILNEEFLSEEQEELYAAFGLRDIASLEIGTEEPVKLAMTSLNDTLEYLPQLAGAFENISQKIRSGDYLRGLELLQENVQLVQSFNQLIDGIRQVLMIDLYQIQLDDDEGSSFAVLNNRLKEIAGEILKAAESENWSELADLLEYELSPLLYRYMGAIPFVIEAVNKTREKTN
jgi:hypothetical protein